MSKWLFLTNADDPDTNYIGELFQAILMGVILLLATVMLYNIGYNDDGSVHPLYYASAYSSTLGLLFAVVYHTIFMFRVSIVLSTIGYIALISLILIRL